MFNIYRFFSTLSIFFFFLLPVRAQTEVSIYQAADVQQQIQNIRTPKEKIDFYTQLVTGQHDLDREKALDYLSEAESLLPLKEDPQQTADARVKVGIAYYHLMELDKSLYNLLEAYTYLKDYPELRNLNVVENELSNVYMQNKLYDKAEKHMKNVYERVLKKPASARDLAVAEGALGYMYSRAAFDMPDSTLFDSSIYYLSKANVQFESLKDTPNMIKCYVGMGESYSNLDDGFDTAQKYYHRALVLVSSGNTDIPLKSYVYNFYTRFLCDFEIGDSAVFYAEKNFKLQENTNSFERLQAARTLYRVYILVKEYEKAARFYTDYEEMEEELNQIEKYGNIQKMLYAQENPRKASWVEKNWHWMVILILSISGLAALYLRKRQVSALKEKERIASELEMKEEALLSAEDKIKEANIYISMFKSELAEKEKIIRALRQPAAAENSIDFENLVLLTEEDWKEFKIQFLRLYPDFFVNLRSVSDSITPALERVAALLQIGLEHYQIAGVLGIGKDSVSRTQRRLKKSLQIDNKEDFTDWYHQRFAGYR